VRAWWPTPGGVPRCVDCVATHVATGGEVHHLVGELARCSAENATAVEMVHDGGAMNVELAGEHVDRAAVLVAGDEVIDVSVGEPPLDRV